MFIYERSIPKAGWLLSFLFLASQPVYLYEGKGGVLRKEAKSFVDKQARLAINRPNKLPTITSLVSSKELLIEYDRKEVKNVLLKINSVSNKLCSVMYIDKLYKTSKPTANMWCDQTKNPKIPIENIA